MYTMYTMFILRGPSAYLYKCDYRISQQLMTLFTAVARQRAVPCKTNLLQSYVTCHYTTEAVYNKLPSVCTFHLQTSSEYSYYIWYTSKVKVKQVKLLYVNRVLATMAYDGMEE